MKNLFIIFITLLFVSCQENNPSNTDEIKKNIIYFKDHKTGICFAAINSQTSNSYQVTSITCVPCDSLKVFKGF